MAELTQEHFEGYMNSFAKTVKEGFDSVDEQFIAVRKDSTGIRGDITGIRGDITKIQATMVTKDYLDEKMADLRGDLVVLMRKEDTKLKKLIEKLRARNVLDDRDVQDIVRMEPFAVVQP